MLGFLSIGMDSGLISHGWRLMSGKDGPWLAPPSKARVDRDGNKLTSADGKPIFDNLVEFRSKAIADRFREQVLNAIRRDCPNLLDGA